MGIKAKVLGEILSSNGLLRLKVIDFIDENNKTIAIFCFFEYIICNRVARSLLALGTKLRLVLSFFTLRRDFMDLKLVTNK